MNYVMDYAEALLKAETKVRKIHEACLEKRPEDLKRKLREYGAWDDEELADHAQNLQRILWIAAGDITERN